MTSSSRRHLYAVTWLALMTVGLTYPLILDPASLVKDHGDPLLNSWILAWEWSQVQELDLRGFFDTNIFYPHSNTLAYSEVLIPQLVVAAPVLALTGEPVLAHNVVLLLSFFATALGTYALAFYLTRSAVAGVVGGMVLAFSPFMFSHLSHLQILFAAGIPLAFLFAHRFFAHRRTSDLMACALCYSVQVLANGYYGVYLTYFLGAYLVIGTIRRGLWRERRFWLQASFFLGVALMLLGPFYLQYFELRQAMGFRRTPAPGAELGNFLGTEGFNRLYGPWLERFAQPEAHLFPGLLAPLLALVALRSRFSPRSAGREASGDGAPRLKAAAVAVGALGAGVLGLILFVGLGGSFEGTLLGLSLSISSSQNLWVLLICLGIAEGALLSRLWRRGQWRPLRPSRALYPAILLVAFLASIRGGIHPLLFEAAPGFDGLRAVTRIHVFTLFALAVLAAEGIAHLQRRRSGGRGRWVLLAPLLLALELASVPLPLVEAPRPAEFPDVHRWLAAQQEELSYVIYPFRGNLEEHRRLYFSTLHWHRSVNGFSGYIPPLYEELRERGGRQPSWRTLAELRTLGVDLVLVDTELYGRRERRQVLRRMRRRTGGPSLRWAGKVAVFDLRRDPPPPPPTPRAKAETWLEAGSLALKASARDAAAAADGDRATPWRVPMRAGHWLSADLGAPRRVQALRLDVAGAPLAYPRGYRVEGSLDGESWSPLTEEEAYHPPLPALLRPTEMAVEIPLPPAEARFLKITLTRGAARRTWEVFELAVGVVGPAHPPAAEPGARGGGYKFK